jgi:hypothetical protein
MDQVGCPLFGALVLVPLALIALIVVTGLIV